MKKEEIVLVEKAKEFNRWNRVSNDEIFIAGYELCQKEYEENFGWIKDSDDEKPTYAAPVLVKFHNDTYIVAHYLRHKHRPDSFYSYPEPDIEFLIDGVKEWCYFKK